MYENSVAVEDCGRTYGNATGVFNNTRSEAADSNAPFNWQPDAPRDIGMISSSLNTLLPWKLRGWLYEIGAGIETYICVIDNGINVHNRVSNEFPLSDVEILIRFQEFTSMPWPPWPAVSPRPSQVTPVADMGPISLLSC